MNAEGISKDDKLWAVFAHLSAVIAMILSAGLLVFLGPLIIWLLKKEESQFVGEHAKEALNFQVTVLLVSIALFFVSVVTCGIGVPLTATGYLALLVIVIVFSIMGAMKANDGHQFRYPLSIRLIK